MGWSAIPLAVTLGSLGLIGWYLSRSLIGLFELIALLALSNICLGAWLIWALAT
ncbi:hypothetical protein [Sinorhizobium americanum]|uniref:Transmembrane protein n=1 Tax=Sinorhizobium americanum TaxID=194963 RepID=A0A4R2BTS9_9HYPH|nr:hypothetical protein [Sinorhizobium americanum]TCN30325.1 hypothetical protein EV184_108199 [Sinorhizobium americanum]